MIKDNGLLEDFFYIDDDEDTQKDKYLSFKIREEEYGVEISCVIEVIGMQKITEIPDMPDFIKGVINLRGQVIPVTDVRTRFKLEPKEYTDRTCILVVNVNETHIGLIVDTVSDVLDIPEDDVDPPPTVNAKPGSRFIKGMGKINEDVLIILDVQKILYEDELEQIDLVNNSDD